MALSVEEIPFFKGLSETEFSAVKECLREKAFEKNQTLFLEGKTCERVFFVRSGRVKLYRMSPSGREQILETLGSGDTCACNPGSRQWQCGSSAEAASACVVWFLSRDHYIRLVEQNAKLAHSLNRLFAERLQCFSALIEEVSLKDSKKRLVKFLLDLGNENKSGALRIPFTREELAQRLGMARETVARQLYRLKRLKLIDIDPRQIRIRNKTGLEKLLAE
ncbi:MAG: Crp/Fnr family transcriptional regulator [Candidatus Omnitrophica bacterium]|nr:Crp/Fnr family transcriptional regulator [Candidatus Omnitrophota bacterium]